MIVVSELNAAQWQSMPPQSPLFYPREVFQPRELQVSLYLSGVKSEKCGLFILSFLIEVAKIVHNSQIDATTFADQIRLALHRLFSSKETPPK